MNKGRSTDFLLCAGALAVSVTVALLAALKMIEASTALVFLGLSVACVAMSQLDLSSFANTATKKPRKKSRIWLSKSETFFQNSGRSVWNATG